MPLQSIPTGLQAHLQGTDPADNNLDGVKCTVHHLGSGGVADIVSVTMPDLAVRLFSTRALGAWQTLCLSQCQTLQSGYSPPEEGLLRMIHHYANKGQNWSRLFVGREWSSLIIEHSREVIENSSSDIVCVQLDVLPCWLSTMNFD